MNKKGILFTVTTFLLLWSLLIINMTYANRSNELQELVLTTTTGDKLKYLEDDITGDLFYDLFDLNLSSTRESDNVTIIMNGILLSNEINHETSIKNYEDYIEDTYSTLNNLNVELTNLSSSFIISPYENKVSINSSLLSSITAQPENIKSVFIKIIVDKSVDLLNTNSTPIDNGNKSINVQIVNEGGTSLLSDESALLSPSELNQPFKTTFSDNSSISVEYGNHLYTDSSILITATNLNATISIFKITFKENTQTLKVTSGMLYINHSDRTISKQTKIVLFEE